MLFSPPRKTSTRKGRMQLIVFQTLRLLGSSTTGTPGPGLSHSAEGTREALRVREGVVEGLQNTHPALARARQQTPVTVVYG